MSIKIENVNKKFGSREILNGISVEFLNNKFTGIIGPNGSGKSTLLKCIYRILKPDKGSIYLDNQNINSYIFKESAQKQAVLAQHNYNNFNFSVLDIVLMGRTPYKKIMERDNAEDYKIAYDSLDIVGMRNFADCNFSDLSGGEQQRVMLARALTQKTKYLILDEPTNHLDVKYQLQLLKTIKEQNITVIAAIHDLNLAAMYCDYIISLKDGKIYKCGKPNDVFTHDFIKCMFEVNAEIMYLKNGRIVVVYND